MDALVQATDYPKGLDRPEEIKNFGEIWTPDFRIFANKNSRLPSEQVVFRNVVPQHCFCY